MSGKSPQGKGEAHWGRASQMPDKGAGPLPFLPPFKGLGERPRQGRGLAPSLVGKYLGWGDAVRSRPD